MNKYKGFLFKGILGAVGVILCIMVNCNVVKASEEGEQNDFKNYEQLFDFSTVDDVLSDDKESFDFSEMVKNFVAGNTDEAVNQVWSSLKKVFLGEIEEQKNIMTRLIILGIASAIFTCFASAITKSSISQTGFYITFMMLMGLMTTGYLLAADLVKKTLERIIEVMESIVPIYAMSVSFAAGQSSAVAFYQVFSIIMVIVQQFFLNFIIPAIYIFMMMTMINCISEENFLSKTCELIKSVIEWILKAFLALIIGLNLIKGLINPVVDAVKTSSFGKVMGMIPGMGNVFSSVSGIVIGSGTLIKNSIGAAAVVVLSLICLVPVVKVSVISLGYKACAAVLEPVSDKRIVNALFGVCESIKLLTKTLLYSMSFFMLTIALVCVTTSRNG